MEQAEIIDTFWTYQMPPCIPFSINNHQFVLLHDIFYHFICYVLNLERLALFVCVLYLFIAIAMLSS